MKIIEALKKEKDLQRKLDDLRSKISQHCAHMSFENPIYEDQKHQVSKWIQSCEDIIKEIGELRLKVQRTNLATEVTIEIDDKLITKSIAAWIHRRRDLAKEQLKVWSCLSDRGLQDGSIKQSDGQMQEIKVVRYFKPEQRDEKQELYSSEPSLIDARLEIVNAITDLV
jgi:peptide subunit release factor RF-3